MKKSSLLLSVAAIAMSFGLLSCGNTKDDNMLYLFNWTYYTPDSVLQAFEKEYGCTVKVDTFDSNEVMYAKLKAGATGYDITFPSQDYASIMISQDMLKEIDKTQFENAKYINPAVLAKTTYDPDMKYCVPYYMGAAGVAVNRQKLQNYSRNWDIFADKRIAGHASMMDDMREVMGDALAFQGHSVNSLDDGELKAASDMIIKDWKPNLVKFD